MSSSLSWLREPLLQFLLLAAVLFAVDGYVMGNRDDPRRIVIDDQRLLDLISIFEEGQGRQPTADELNNLIIKWSQNEILYREAQQLEMDQGDEMIRNRLVLKMRNVLFNRIIVDTPSEDELTTFFEFHRDQYDDPAYYDFELIALPKELNGPAVTALLNALNQGDSTPEQAALLVRRYQQRPLGNLETMLGAHPARALLDSAPPAGTGAQPRWSQINAETPIMLARLTHTRDAQPARLAEVRNQVIRDWKQFRNEIQMADQTKALADQYTIRLNLSPELNALVETSGKTLSQISAHVNPRSIGPGPAGIN
ncbi:MAG: peptidylprolyl isomerase [Pseudomonadota bacterium]|nr:peptidylprolyl isomerase [Pseudomonadota bacterium]